jgi:hypothetical protein
MELESNETKLGSWTTNMVMPGGMKFLGRLTVTDCNVFFEAKYDSSMSGLASSVLFDVKEEDGVLRIPRELIEGIEPKSGFLKKTITLKVKEEGDFVINNGMMSIAPILKALEGSR